MRLRAGDTNAGAHPLSESEKKRIPTPRDLARVRLWGTANQLPDAFSAVERVVGEVILQHCYNGRSCFVGHDRIARYSRVHRASVIRALKVLIEGDGGRVLPLLTRSPRTGRRGFNYHIVTDPKALSAAREKRAELLRAVLASITGQGENIRIGDVAEREAERLRFGIVYAQRQHMADQIDARELDRIEKQTRRAQLALTRQVVARMEAQGEALEIAVQAGARSTRSRTTRHETMGRR